jgi:arginyl-tRNA synthetase
LEKLLDLLKASLFEFFLENYPEATPSDFLFQPTNIDHKGNLTLMVFPLAKLAKLNPDILAGQIGEYLKGTDYVQDYEVIRGFLNIELSNPTWELLLNQFTLEVCTPEKKQKIVLEYCGPNTNKPLHVGHLRNMFLGYSVAEILREAGHEVHKVNIFNDRGIAICKSMMGYIEYGNHSSPESEGLKEDFFIGKYYILFSAECKKQSLPFIAQGLKKEEAEAQTEIFKKAEALLVKWEEGDPETIALWQKMNDWFYCGVRKTYLRLGIDTEKDYYESQEYKKGKEIVEIGYRNGAFQKEESGAIYIDLTEKGMDKKYLQRSNGTSLYITQDMSLVKTRYEDYHMDRMIYVVGDEQNYHFKVLKHIVEAMQEPFSKDIYHLSYGLVLGKDGQKFKSREGTDADADLIANMVAAEAQIQTNESGKADSFTESEIEVLSEKIGLGALKYAMLKVTATKSILFDPKEAVKLNGDTGTFIVYCAVRIKSILAKWNEPIEYIRPEVVEPEVQNLILALAAYKQTIIRAAETLDPSEIAQFALNLAKVYNRFYTQLPILKEENVDKKLFRLYLTHLTSDTLVKCLQIMGMPIPERM